MKVQFDLVEKVPVLVSAKDAAVGMYRDTGSNDLVFVFFNEDNEKIIVWFPKHKNTPNSCLAEDYRKTGAYADCRAVLTPAAPGDKITLTQE